MDETDIERLLVGMQLTDSALPTGAFAHSFGFESYQQSEQIWDADSFALWLESFINQQLTFTDALAVRMVYATTAPTEIERIDQLVTAQALPAQVREASMTMGKRLLKMCGDNFPSPSLAEYAKAVDAKTVFGHPAIVWAIVARESGIAVDSAVAQHVYAAVISLVQNAVRSFPLGQNSGQKIVRRAQPWVRVAVEVSRSLGPEDVGAIAPGLEIAQMNHERQLSRLFMS